MKLAWIDDYKGVHSHDKFISLSKSLEKSQ
jgi:hypothetical protein